MEPEQSQNFNERLSQWVANQGFWFQLRYSLSGSGSKGTAAFHLLRMAFRLSIFLLLVAVGGWIYLMKRVDSDKFAETLDASLRSGFSAKESEVKGISQSQGKLGISRITMEGGNDTFFSMLEARNVRIDMGLLDGLAGEWDTGNVTATRLDVDLRAGADDTEASKKVGDALFKKTKGIVFDSLEVADASIRWGYTDKTRGSILNSNLKVHRLDDGMILTFRGGTFSQNWLNKLEIVEMVVTCNREGFVFEKAELRQAQGTVDLGGMKVIGGDRPKIEGLAKLEGVDLDGVLPAALKTFLEGSISGDFKVSGSTNTAEGIAFSGRVNLEGNDTVFLRKRIHLLQALSDIDYLRNYRRVGFSEGSFQIKIQSNGTEITDVDLKSADFMTLEGSMKVRLPTREETAEALNRPPVSNSSSRFSNAPDDIAKPAASEDGSDITLRRAAEVAKKGDQGISREVGKPLADRIGLNTDMQRMEELATEQMSRTLRYEGAFRISLPGDAFERVPKLMQEFPVDPVTKRIPIVVPIEGGLYDLTLKQAEEIYRLRKE